MAYLIDIINTDNETNIIEQNMNLIKTILYFDDKSKVHIQKNELTHETLCGINLGFRFTVIEDKTDNIDVKNSDIICKKCKNKYFKTR